jgi:hypothetical protein
MIPTKTQTIFEFNKNLAELVRISLVEFKRKRYVDLRLYYDASESEIPDWKPSKRGLCIGVDLLAELKEAIDKAAEEYEKELFGLGEKGRDNGRTDQKDSGACMNGGGQEPDRDAKTTVSREEQGKGGADD